MKIDRLVCDFAYKCRVCGNEFKACCVLAEFRVESPTLTKGRVIARTKYDRDRTCPKCKVVAGAVVAMNPASLEWC